MSPKWVMAKNRLVSNRKHAIKGAPFQSAMLISKSH